MGLNKKLIAAGVAISAFIAITVLTYKSLEGIQDLDLGDPFEVDFDDE
jgi:hypothetical protein